MISRRGDGISSFNGGFFLQGISYSGTEVPSTISGFRHGIRAVNLMNKAIKVTHSTFTDNWFGIYANSCNNAMIFKNNFFVGSKAILDYSLPAGQPAFAGLALVRSRGFKVEENAFETFKLGTGTINPVGIQVHASGRYYNEIYKNTFKDLEVSNLANDGNRGPNPNIGLQYLCNESLGNNNYDIAVESSNPAAIPGSIGEHQGNSATAAGNTFTNVPPFSDSHIKNEMEDIEYFFASGERPDSTTAAPFVIKTQSNQENTCLSQLPNNYNGDISESEKQQYESGFNNGSIAGEKAYYANLLVHHYLTDSLEYNLDSARYWLTAHGELEDHFHIVNTFIGEKDETGAQAALDNIPVVLTLEGEDLIEYEYFDSLKTIQIGALSAGKTEQQMVAQSQNVLTTIADATAYLAAGEARALLNYYNGEVYLPEIHLPVTSEQQQLVKPPNSNHVLGFEHTDYSIVAVPNPTKGETEFKYQLSKDEQLGKLTISSANGQLIYEFDLGYNRGRVVWDSRKVEKGVYFYTLWLDGKKVRTQRLIVIN